MEYGHTAHNRTVYTAPAVAGRKIRINPLNLRYLCAKIITNKTIK